MELNFPGVRFFRSIPGNHPLLWRTRAHIFIPLFLALIPFQFIVGRFNSGHLALGEKRSALDVAISAGIPILFIVINLTLIVSWILRVSRYPARFRKVRESILALLLFGSGAFVSVASLTAYLAGVSENRTEYLQRVIDVPIIIFSVAWIAIFLAMAGLREFSAPIPLARKISSESLAALNAIARLLPIYPNRLVPISPLLWGSGAFTLMMGSLAIIFVSLVEFSFSSEFHIKAIIFLKGLTLFVWWFRQAKFGTVLNSRTDVVLTFTLVIGLNCLEVISFASLLARHRIDGGIVNFQESAIIWCGYNSFLVLIALLRWRGLPYFFVALYFTLATWFPIPEQDFKIKIDFQTDLVYTGAFLVLLFIFRKRETPLAISVYFIIFFVAIFIGEPDQNSSGLGMNSIFPLGLTDSFSSRMLWPVVAFLLFQAQYKHGIVPKKR